MNQSNYNNKPPKFITHRSPPKKEVNPVNNNSTVNKELNQLNQVINPQYIQPNITNTTINNQNYQMIFPYQIPQTVYYQKYQVQTMTQTGNNQNIVQNNNMFKTQNFNNQINTNIQVNNKLISINSLILASKKNQILNEINSKKENANEDGKKRIQFKIRKCRK